SGYFDDFAPDAQQDFRQNFWRWTIYGYQMWRPIEPLQIIGGISYDMMAFPENFRDAPLSSETEHVDRVSPKAGLIWAPAPNTIVRAAYTRSIAGPSVDQSIQLGPSQVAGFVQSFRSLAPESVVGAKGGARFETFGIAVEQKFPTQTY